MFDLLILDFCFLDNDSQRNAAMLAAAAVRAAAAASSRKAGGMAPAPGHYGCVPGYPMNPDLMQQQPFINHAMQSSDFSGGMSPSKDMIMAMNQGRGTPRNNVPPPPYSPSPFSNHSDNNHSASGSVKGSSSSLASGVKTESITNEGKTDHFYFIFNYDLEKVNFFLYPNEHVHSRK